MSVYIFLGPSLPVEEAREVLDAVYLPPVKMGDLYALLRRPVKMIGIIDGFFEQTPAVWHKEILYALSRGVRVLGASSMGALRAAELEDFGMEGVGKIFDGFRRGEHEDDDEVTVAHGPAESGYRVLSDAMVNIRHGLQLAAAAGILSAASHRLLLDAAKSTFYAERSWALLWDQAPTLGLPSGEIDALQAFVKREKPDLKREDALALLRRIAELRQRRIRPPKTDFDFEPTIFWQHLTAISSRPAAADDSQDLAAIDAEKIRNHIRLAHPRRRELMRSALLLHLVEAEARRAGIADRRPSPAMVERFRRSRQLLSKEAMDAWLKRHGLTKDEAAELVRLETLCQEMMESLAAEVDHLLPKELQLRNTYDQVVDDVERKWRYLDQQGLSSPTVADTGASIEAVLEWYQARYGQIHSDLESHFKELGFGSSRQFLTELLALYIFESAETAAPEKAPDREPTP